MPSDVTMLCEAIGDGDQRAAAELLPRVYRELRRLASARLAKLPPGQTLQTTALVHEAYLRLVGGADPGWNGRAHFFGAAAQAMRDILVDQARRKASLKHGGGHKRVGEIEELPIEVGGVARDHMLELDEALARLEKLDPRKARVVMLRYFAGLEPTTIAELLDVSARTVERDWRFARSWLQSELGIQV